VSGHPYQQGQGSPHAQRRTAATAASRFIDGLTAEAVGLLREISPTAAEAHARQQLVGKLLGICREHFPDAAIEVNQPWA